LRGARLRNRAVENAGRIVPWYQDFTLGKPKYGAAQLRAQLQAGYDNGMFSWMLWNPGSRYTVSALRPAIRDTSEESPKWIAHLASDSASAPVIAPLKASVPTTTVDSVSRAIPPR
jgi:hypothetical protein